MKSQGNLGCEPTPVHDLILWSYDVRAKCDVCAGAQRTLSNGKVSRNALDRACDPSYPAFLGDLRGVIITLIRPPRLFSRTAITANVPVPPLGLAYLAGALSDAGFDTLSIDACGESPDDCRPLDDLPFVVNGLDVDEIAA